MGRKKCKLLCVIREMETKTLWKLERMAGTNATNSHEPLGEAESYTSKLKSLKPFVSKLEL